MPNRDTAMRLRGGGLTSAVAEGEDYDSGARRDFPGGRGKHLNENLAPLERYLRKQVGRPWCKVYGEVCAAIDTRSAIGFHVLQHVPDFVATDTFAVGKVVYQRHRLGSEWPVQGLYVHPKTGLLRYAEQRRWRPPEREGNFVQAGELLEFDKRNGLWFRLDFVAGEDGTRMLVSRRQCDRKTIRQIERGDWGDIVYVSP